MPCLRSLGKTLRLYDFHVRSQVATIGLVQTAALLQQRASITDFVCEPATGTPAHPFQPISSASTTGDTFVPKGAKLSGHGAHPLARYRYGLSGLAIRLPGLDRCCQNSQGNLQSVSKLAWFSDCGMQTYNTCCCPCRSFFPESVWKQIDCLFPRGCQPVAYDIAIGTGRGAIELAKRQGSTQHG